jgi:hypothetical protein
MAEIKEFKPKPLDTTRGKPEKPADVVDIGSGRKKKEMKESVDTSTVLADAFDLVREGQLSDAEIDDLKSITENEKTLLKVVSGLFERLRKYDEEVEELRDSVKKLRQEKEE